MDSRENKIQLKEKESLKANNNMFCYKENTQKTQIGTRKRGFSCLRNLVYLQVRYINGNGISRKLREDKRNKE